MKKRIVWIDILRIIGILGVIFMHVSGSTIKNIGNMNSLSYHVYLFISYFFEFAIPLFVMISGMMFLRKKNLTFKEMFKKYCLKIILIIVIIGTIMILMEELFRHRDITIMMIITRLLTGKIWAHMWYLYMILGIYLITPALTLITNNIKEKEYKRFLIILFILTIFLNTINDIFNITNAINFINISGYLFYYFYGYYIFKYSVSKEYKITNYILSVLSIIYIVYVINNGYDLNTLFSYTTIVPFIISSSLILLLKDKRLNKCNKLITSIGKCNLGIYVFHQFFINIIFKVLKPGFINYNLYISLIINVTIVFICSYIFTYLIKKIKIIDKYLI